MVAASALLRFVAFTLPLVSGHGIVSSPPAEFPSDVMRTKYVDTIHAFLPGKFDDSPQVNVANFNAAFKAQSQFKTLRDMLDPHGPDCGNSLTNVAKKAIPSDGKMTWQNPDTGEGFIPSHTGPCEVWLDNKRVFQNDDCATNFGDKPAAHLPVDYSSCAGDGCMLRFYWIALHQPEWQVYKNCVPLQGNGQNPGPAPQPNSGDQCANAKSDLDYYGNDMKNLGVWGSAQDQFSQCCAACSSTNGCAGFSINSGVCWLKHTLGNPTPRAGVVSASASGASAGSSSQCGSSVSTDVDYYGNDIRSFGVNGDTAAQVAQCCNGCSTTTGCVGFSINANTCWLKSSVANPSPANGVVSVRMAQHRLRRAL